MAKHFALTITDDGLASPATTDRDRRGGGARRLLRHAHHRAGRDVSTPRRPCSPTRAWPGSSAPSARSRPSISRSGRSTIGCAGRVRAHVFLCMLAYHVEWHMRAGLAPLLFDDHDRPAAAAPDASPVAAAEVSPAAAAKAAPAHRRRRAGAQLPHASSPISPRSPATPCASAMPCRSRARRADPAAPTRLRPPRRRPHAVGRDHPPLVASLSGNQRIAPRTAEVRFRQTIGAGPRRRSEPAVPVRFFGR